MAITMTSYAIRWTDPDGVPRAAGVSYDKASAEDRKTRLTAEKGTPHRDRAGQVRGAASACELTAA
ncbi:hypothetical protein ACGFSG_25590 [Streptomyces sp. NPDC048512]|uniref:hypothetical protein n=1 Tax=unclassified Streptomyces TaxID=2593676 RepID=UPI0015C422BF|nr:hypothetical protein [Streptomyces sp. M41(2017)]